ncbi:ArnT family glycosyltransferase [Amycolatopsis minnesotensis]|uniref:Glycosyltransferase family 39 protein n=1 Tax=Amycolatopsis minnesotensis TaxID=337894 RepID=A0ABN2S6C9_9PSEU
MHQTQAVTERDRAATVPAFAAPAVFLIAAVVVAAHLAVSAGTEYYLDETYMLGLARHPLEWGYADQPPIAVLVAWLADHVAPGSMFALHVVPALATGATLVFAALTARELGADRRAQVITVLATVGGVWLMMSGHFLAPYTLEPLEWGLLFFLLVRWLRTRQDRLLVWFGVVMGISAETKFQVLLLAAVLLVAVLVCGPRELLARPMLWLGAAIAVLLAAPTLLWQLNHGWPQLKMGAVVGAEAQFLAGGRPGVTIALLVFAGIAGTYLVCYGLWRLLREPDHRFLAVTFLALFVFFVITLGRQYYLQGFYPVLIAAGAVGLQRRREDGGRRWRWAVWPAAALSVATAVGMLIVSWTIINPAGGSVGQRLATGAGQVYQGLSPQQRERTAVFGESYVVAADLDVFGPEHGLPLAYSGNRGYGYLAPPADTQDQVLYVGRDPKELRPFFASVQRLQVLGDDGYAVWTCTGKRASWQDIWPKITTLTVS